MKTIIKIIYILALASCVERALAPRGGPSDASTSPLAPCGTASCAEDEVCCPDALPISRCVPGWLGCGFCSDELDCD